MGRAGLALPADVISRCSTFGHCSWEHNCVCSPPSALQGMCGAVHGSVTAAAQELQWLFQLRVMLWLWSLPGAVPDPAVALECLSDL